MELERSGLMWRDRRQRWEEGRWGKIKQQAPWKVGNILKSLGCDPKKEHVGEWIMKSLVQFEPRLENKLDIGAMKVQPHVQMNYKWLKSPTENPFAKADGQRSSKRKFVKRISQDLFSIQSDKKLVSTHRRFSTKLRQKCNWCKMQT